MAWKERAHRGRIASVTILQSGKMSVVVHLPVPDSDLRYGLEVELAVCED